MMKNLLLSLFFLLCLLGVPVTDGSAESNPSPVFDFTLPLPEAPEDRQYLGLPDTGNGFRLSQVAAPIVLIEIFSMYCPICQKEAPGINRLFSMIQEDDKLRQRIRMLGIGAGNSPFETDFFRSSAQIAFPLFSDRDFTIHKKVGEVGTPHFFGLRRLSGDKMELFFSHSGPIQSPEIFLQRFLAASQKEGKP